MMLTSQNILLLEERELPEDAIPNNNFLQEDGTSLDFQPLEWEKGTGCYNMS